MAHTHSLTRVLLLCVCVCVCVRPATTSSDGPTGSDVQVPAPRAALVARLSAALVLAHAALFLSARVTQCDEPFFAADLRVAFAGASVLGPALGSYIAL